MECWHENIYQAMIDAAEKRPLLSTYQGKLLKSMIDSIDYDRCLDIGCGTAQVHEICHDYIGIDLPDIIFSVPRKIYPDVCQLFLYPIEDEAEYAKDYDLVIMSAYIDIMEKPLDMLEPILKRCNKYVIIHRQEISQNKPTQAIKNPSYGGWTWHSIINRKDFNKVIKGFEILELKSCKYENWGL